MFLRSYPIERLVTPDADSTVRPFADSHPGANAPFSITVKDPVGIEGLKTIATNVPIDFADVLEHGTFAGTQSPDKQRRLSDLIRQATARIGVDEWDLAEWTFEIRE